MFTCDGELVVVITGQGRAGPVGPYGPVGPVGPYGPVGPVVKAGNVIVGVIVKS